jgi:hypothetical protein
MAALLLPTFGWADQSSDKAAIKQRLATYAQTRERGDAHEEAKSHTLNADFRAFGGALIHERDATEKALVVNVLSYRFALTVDHVNFLDANVAVAVALAITGSENNQRSWLRPTQW